MLRKSFLLLSILCLLNVNTWSQQWWYGSFDNICDDREYFSGYATSQTILGARLDLGSGFEIDSVHEIYAGLNYMFEYGHKPFANPIPDTGLANASWNPIVDLYYKYQVKNFRMFFGSFPRHKLLNYPLALLTDTFQYYRPNIQGGLGELSGDWGYQNVWCDWVSRQTYTAREQFMAGASGHIKYGNFYIEDYFYMFHNAGNMISDSTSHVQDNGGGACYVGYNFDNMTPLETLRFDIGMIGCYDRFRPTPYTLHSGFQCRLSAFYKYIGVDATYYNGDKLSLVNGDKFYSNTGNYARIDAYLRPIKSKHTDSKIGWSFHIHDGKKQLDNSFQVFFRVDFLNRKG